MSKIGYSARYSSDGNGYKKDPEGNLLGVRWTMD